MYNNSLQSLFLSFAWPWPGRPLPRGNQQEWWDPQQGALPGLGEVGHFPRGTSESAGTLDLGPMWFGSQSTCHPNTPTLPDTLNSHLYHLGTSQWHYATYTPSGSWVPTLTTSPKYTPDTPNSSQHPLHPLGDPLCHLYSFWPWVPTLPASPPLHIWHPYTP